MKRQRSMTLIAHVTVWQQSISVSHPRRRGFIFMNTTFIMQKFLLRHHRDTSQLPLQASPWTHRAYLLHSPYWSGPQHLGKYSLFWLCTDSRPCLTAWLPTFAEVFSEDVISATGSKFCERCKLSISFPNPVSLSLLAPFYQRASICDSVGAWWGSSNPGSLFQVFRGRCINDFQHAVICGGRV